MTTKDRPAIPESIKREVRQQCFFGCAICGMPFFQYDHIQEYSEVKKHEASNLILLCPNHHSAKTTNKLSTERIIEAKRSPFNTNRSFTSPFTIEKSKEIKVLLGSNEVSGWFPDGYGEHHAIWINGKSFFTIHAENEWLSISLVLTDSNGKILLVINRGELHSSTAEWDYLYEGDNIKIRAGLRDVLLDLKVSDQKVEILKGGFLDSGLDGYHVQNGMLETLFQGKSCGISIGSSARGNGFGGWGILNSNKYPNIQKPGGFGFFRGS